MPPKVLRETGFQAGRRSSARLNPALDRHSTEDTMPMPRLLAILAALLFALPARAGDLATVEILGFSADGGIFAFEEYGVQDGSGFPYANRYYIDTESDRFLPDTPIRVRLDDEQATVEAAREEAKTRAQSIISDEELMRNRGFQAGWNAVTELSADPHRMMVNPRPIMPPLDAPLEFRIEELLLNEPEACRDMGRIAGFRLLRIGVEPGAETALIHEDHSIPASRGCPRGYCIAGKHTIHPEGGEPVYAVLIAVRRVGFEGPDHRFLAVTGRL
jgi:predicted secreted protein